MKEGQRARVAFLDLGPVPKKGSFAITADKEGQSVLVRARVQPVRNGMA